MGNEKDYPGLSGLAQYNTLSLWKKKKEKNLSQLFSKKESRTDGNVRRTEPRIAGFEDEEAPTSQIKQEL